MKKTSRKIIFKATPLGVEVKPRVRFTHWEMVGNQNKDSAQFLTSWQIEMLERRKQMIIDRQKANEALDRLTKAIVESNIVAVEDMPQGTQLVKVIDGNKFVKFHYC